MHAGGAQGSNVGGHSAPFFVCDLPAACRHGRGTGTSIRITARRIWLGRGAVGPWRRAPTPDGVRNRGDPFNPDGRRHRNLPWSASQCDASGHSRLACDGERHRATLTAWFRRSGHFSGPCAPCRPVNCCRGAVRVRISAVKASRCAVATSARCACGNLGAAAHSTRRRASAAAVVASACRMPRARRGSIRLRRRNWSRSRHGRVVAIRRGIHRRSPRRAVVGSSRHRNTGRLVVAVIAVIAAYG